MSSEIVGLLQYLLQHCQCYCSITRFGIVLSITHSSCYNGYCSADFLVQDQRYCNFLPSKNVNWLSNYNTFHCESLSLLQLLYTVTPILSSSIFVELSSTRPFSQCTTSKTAGVDIFFTHVITITDCKLIYKLIRAWWSTARTLFFETKRILNILFQS